MKQLLLIVLLVSACGKSGNSDLKIVGGTQSPQKKWYGRMEVGNRFVCGSTLIHRKWVLTAKHCLPDSAKQIKVRLGAVSFSADNGGKPFDLVPVVDVIPHPSFDLALLGLSRPAKFSPIRFSAGRDVADRQRLRAFGFGQLGHDKPIPQRLQTVIFWNIADGGNRDPARHMIYVGAPGGKDVCFGDSGGPLINTKKRELVGVASWTGTYCGSRGDSVQRPSGFVRPDVAWIKSHVR